ncbi:hypothetical protein ABZS77_21875 [Micromonospora sp. NPDC005298]|uniref:hypothetical protein n=1 Tax=Micromonospora sp. NPDC005298 TaxID=3156873 RepID=UPI0033AF10F9
MPTGIELWLAQQVGSVAAKQVLQALTRRSFPSRLVSRLGRHEIAPKLTFWEKWRIRRLVREPEVWHLLLAVSPTSIDGLARRIDAQVIRSAAATELPSSRALLVAQTVQDEIMGALDLNDAQAGLSHQVRSVNDSVLSVGAAVDGIGSDIKQLRDVVGSQEGVDPDVLLRGPLEALQVASKHVQAQELSETDPVGAARLFGAVADRLEAEGYGGLGRPLRMQQARLLTRGHEAAMAAAAWMPLVLQDLSEGSASVCREATAAFEQLASVTDAPAWLPARARAVELAERWFRDPGLTCAEMVSAARDAVEGGDPEAPALLVLVAEAALADGELSAVASAKRLLPAVVATAKEEVSIRFELALADAEQDEVRWKSLLDRASPGIAGMSTRAAALVYARRGRYLHWASELQDAEAAYRAAVERACRAKLWQDAAEWMHARARILVRASAIGNITEVAARAAAVRASGSGGLLQRGYDPHTRALEYLLANKLNAALPELRRHLRDSTRLAHLDDELEAHRQLGSLYEKTEREPAAAVHHYVQAGEAKAAAHLAARTSFYIDCSLQAEHPQAQTQAAALQATAKQGDLVPDADVDAWTTRALRAATGPRDGFIGPLPWVQGFAVLAALAERIGEPHLKAVLTAMDPMVPRAPNRYTWVDNSIIRIVADLALYHPARRQELAKRMVDIFDASDQMARRLLDESAAVQACLEHLREPLRQRAANGNRMAVQLLAIHGDTDPMVVAAAERQVKAAIEQPPAYGPGYMAGLADVALPAHVARCLPVDRQCDLARDYIRRALDGQDSENNRRQAMEGCGVLAPELPDAVRRELLALVLPVARGHSPRSTFDQLNDRYSHPLGSFRMISPVGSLRRAAVIVAASLAVDEETAGQVWEAARPLLRGGDTADSFAASKAAYTLAMRGFLLPIPWAVLASSSDTRQRQAAAALLAVEPAVDASAATDLAKDDQASVRREVAMALDGLAGRDAELARSLASILAQDPRFSVRQSVPGHYICSTEVIPGHNGEACGL